MGPGYRLKFRPRLRRLVRDLSWEAAAGASLGNGVTERGSGATSGIAAVAVAAADSRASVVASAVAPVNRATTLSKSRTATPWCARSSRSRALRRPRGAVVQARKATTKAIAAGS